MCTKSCTVEWNLNSIMGITDKIEREILLGNVARRKQRRHLRKTGKLLIEVKALISSDEWDGWLEENIDASRTMIDLAMHAAGGAL